jgi:ribosomal protein S18 acetylase RimI-like enzyme
MVAADVAMVARLLRELAEKYIVHEFAPAARASFLSKNDEAAIAQFVADGFRYHVAEIDGTIVGFVGVRDNRHLYHLFVAEAHHRRGIARRLWEVASLECRARGHAGAFTVNSSNNAVAVYERLGFRRAAPVQDSGGVLFNPMALSADA